MEQYLGTDELPKNDLITYLQKNADSAFLRHWKLTGTNKSIRKNRNCSQLIAAYKVYVCIQTFFYYEWLCALFCSFKDSCGGRAMVFIGKLNVQKTVSSLGFAALAFLF